MDLGPALIADAQPAELVQPGQRPLHYPPIDAQPTAVGGQTLCQDWLATTLWGLANNAHCQRVRERFLG